VQQENKENFPSNNQSLFNQSQNIIKSETKENVFITKKALDKIIVLNTYISDLEWSGIIFYKYDEANNHFSVEDLLPIDIGTKTYTEFVHGEEIPRYMMANKELFSCCKGKIHSHNTMAVFFSGEDMSDLYQMSQFHNSYFSLIVNNRLDFEAKFCSYTKTEVPFEFKNSLNVVFTHSKELVSYCVTDCNITTIERTKTPFELEVEQLITNHNLKLAEERKIKEQEYSKNSKNYKKGKAYNHADIYRGNYNTTVKAPVSTNEILVEEFLKEFTMSDTIIDVMEEINIQYLHGQYDDEDIERINSLVEPYEKNNDKFLDNVILYLRRYIYKKGVKMFIEILNEIK